ncbi:hypothetical protein DPMN_014855 [Dreissena polymorpha]|uniref:Uncharacterized protein n=1 Tax=Dreissena polymorpha TaxID=45954 RepID=A0A9D4N6S0_DREPO|nr:hypothetical protein DPMN_014855 [Dreissena polymorpha]
MCTGGRQLQDKFMYERSSAKGVQHTALPLWPLSSSPAVYLYPRDGFPSALSVLSTVAQGSLYKATPRCSWDMHLPAKSSPRSAPYVLHTCDLAVPLFPSLYRRDLWQDRISELSTINSG